MEKKLPKCPSLVMFQNDNNNRLQNMNYQKADTIFPATTTQTLCDTSPLQALSNKHFLISLGSDTLVFCAKYKKRTWGFTGVVKCVPKRDKKGAKLPLPPEVSSLLPQSLNCETRAFGQLLISSFGGQKV